VQLLKDSTICRLTRFCDLPCRLSAFYPPFRKHFRIFGFRILLPAFRNLSTRSLHHQHKTNEWILCKLKVHREILDHVKSLKLGFCGHTTRKYLSLEKEIVQGCAPGYRNRGQQRWTDDNTEWTGMMNINEAATAAEDRDHWRWILRAANPSYGGRH